MSTHEYAKRPLVVQSSPYTIVRAATSDSILQAALLYASMGLSVLPLNGKKPIGDWTTRMTHRAGYDMIQGWQRHGILHNVGIVCGTISGNLVVIDLDGEHAIAAYEKLFPHLLDTFTVRTGSGEGKHYYYRTQRETQTIRAINTPLGNLELRSNGLYVVAPPSTYPETGVQYTVDQALDIKKVQELWEVDTWIWRYLGMKRLARAAERDTEPKPAWARMNRRVLDAISGELEGRQFERKGKWLFGACLFVENHKHSDSSPSFGFDTETGRAHCFTCGDARGFIRTLDLCVRLGIDVNAYGGLWEK